MLRLVPGKHLLAWADQAVVSSATFVTLVLIGRGSDAAELGAYALGGSVLALLLAAQEALITRPYAVRLHRSIGSGAEFAFAAFVLSVMLSAVASTALAAAAIAMAAIGAPSALTGVTWALAATIPFALTREFARRFAFAHLQLWHALMVDVAVTVLNLAGLAWLSWTGRLSAVTAFMALGLACGIGSLGWLFFARRRLAFRFDQLRPTLDQSWAFGKWLLSGQLAIQAQGYMTHWLSLVLAGATVTGIYTASMSIVSFANPVLYGFYNLATPRSVSALNRSGPAGLRREAVRDALLLAALMAAFCALVVLAGEDAMRFLYPGPEYRGQAHLLAILALAAMAAAVGAPATIGLAAAEHTPAVAAVMSLTAVLNVLLVWWLMSRWGLLGAAVAVLVSEVVGSVARWAAFLAVVRKLGGSPALRTHAAPLPSSTPCVGER